jgi:hypothetical protein
MVVVGLICIWTPLVYWGMKNNKLADPYLAEIVKIKRIYIADY